MNRHKSRKCQQPHKNDDPWNTSQAFQAVQLNLSVTISIASGKTTVPSFLGDTHGYKEPIQENIYFATQYYYC